MTAGDGLAVVSPVDRRGRLDPFATRLLALALAATAPFIEHARAHADDAGFADRRATIVARIGPAVILVGDVEDGLASLPPFQRTTFGDSVDAVRRRFVTEVLVPHELLDAAAVARRLDERPSVAYALDRARADATIRAIRARIGSAATISLEDVRGYYEEHRTRYDVPERYQLWRILCKTRDEAAAVLEEAKKEPTPAVFAELSRAHSLDKATNLRAGNLGFVTADGLSNEPGLRVDPTIVHAAQSVRDGELVGTPLGEGEYFSVVWRRGTIAARKQTVDDAAASIRDALWKSRVKEQTDQLLATLRKDKLHDFDPALLDALELPAAVEDAARRMPSSRRGVDAGR